MSTAYHINQPIDLPDGRLGMVARVQRLGFTYKPWKLRVITSDGQVQEIYR